jgi:NADPH:quinone reductase
MEGAMATMRAVQIQAYGPPEGLKIAEVPIPTPQAGEVLIKLDLAGISFGDVYQRWGYYKPPHPYATALPYVPGIDGYGRIDACGEGVSGFEKGDRVTYCLGFHSYAEYVIVPAWKVVKVPDIIPANVAVTCMVNGQTAYYLTNVLFPLEPHHTCLVHAGAGSVGQLVIQLAKMRGARVLTTVGSPDKERIVKRLGADVTILYREVDFREAVFNATKGKGVDVVYDSVGASTIKKSLKSLRPRGMCVLYGAASGAVEGSSAIEPMADLGENGSVFLTRPILAHYMTTAFDIERCASALFGAYAIGKLEISIDRTFELADAAKAHEALESRSSTGKLLLRV